MCVCVCVCVSPIKSFGGPTGPIWTASGSRMVLRSLRRVWAGAHAPHALHKETVVTYPTGFPYFPILFQYLSLLFQCLSLLSPYFPLLPHYFLPPSRTFSSLL